MLTTRLRRLRQHDNLRALIRETELSINDFVYPLFVKYGLKSKQMIASMPGQYQLSLNDLKQEIDQIVELKIPAVILFGIPEFKDPCGSAALQEDGIIQQAIREIKSHAPQLLIISDICLCEYTSHGHCGIIAEHNGSKIIDNDATLELLTAQSISHAAAGADIVAPSGMMDGMVAAIRQGLDEKNFKHIPILSYSAKYCSSFYGPFRQAAEGAPQFGNRSSYQMDPANAQQALREVELDIAEGADMLMVKPALSYLDIIQKIKFKFPYMPLCAYQVSGEYSMIKAAAANGWLDEQKVALETLTSIKRAGADFIISYFAKDVAKWLQ